MGWHNDQPVMHPSEKPVEAEDPFDAVALRVPVDDPDQGLLDAAECFVEEFITMGYTDFMILSMFRRPFYMGLHPLYEKRGEEFVRNLIAERRQDLLQRGTYPRPAQKGD